MGHFGDGYAKNAISRRHGIETERRCYALYQRQSRALDIERHFAAEKAIGAQPAEDEIGVGDGGLEAAKAITNGPGPGACTLGPDV
jgi:hypothetical protein